MIRNVVNIDGEKCIGCGKCTEACAEGAIKMIDGKAVLVSEAYCDGLGACLPSCPVDAISIEAKDTEPFVETTASKRPDTDIPRGGIPMTACPGSGVRKIIHTPTGTEAAIAENRLSNWPVQLRLIPPMAPFLNGCDLLLAADCSAFACGDFHNRFIRDRVAVIGCPKLDPKESWNKLKDIIMMNDIRSFTITRMDVPCCSGLVNAALEAIKSSGKQIPVKVYTIFADGRISES